MPANTLEGRNKLIAKEAKLSDLLFSDEASRMTTLQLRRIEAERQEVEREYRDTLPQVTVGRCPFTNDPVTDRIDIFGFDGPFWDTLFEEVPPVGGSTFLFYQGAVSFHGERPDEVDAGENDLIKLGPEVPFVIPRALERKECRCSIASIQLLGGRCTVYFMAYFARPRFPNSDLHSNWLRDTYMYLNPSAEKTLKVSNDLWDFDLAAWVDKPEKVYWLPPGNPNGGLQTGSAADCPYVGLSGEREPIEITDGEVDFGQLPDGQPVGADELLD